MRFMTRLVLAVIAGGILGSLALLPDGNAEAHSGSVWAGSHRTNGVNCATTGTFGTGVFHHITVRAPTVFATPYDNKNFQWVTWRPIIIAWNRFSGSGEWVQREFGWQGNWAYDYYPAAFTHQIVQWPADGRHQVYVYIELQFTSRNWFGQYVVRDSSTHFAGFC